MELNRLRGSIQSMVELAVHTRLRRSPYYEATIAEGASAFLNYNAMLLPLAYTDPAAEYDRLMNGVSMWDVGGERQIQLKGPEAGRLAQILCARDLSKAKIGQGKYVAVCDHSGVLVNDPIALKIDEDCWWLSIADSDVGLWARCVAAERNLDVHVSEPDVSPLAVQGPLAEDVIASMFGDWVRDLKYFWFDHAELDGIPIKVARSGWSKQGGFELYLMDGSRGTDLWNLVKEAGQPWGIGPGYPTPSERIENGLVSWGGDCDANTNPFEVRLGNFVDLDVPDDTIGIQALRRIAEEGPKRHQLGIVLDGDSERPGHLRWYDVLADGAKVGDMTCGTWSFGLERNIGYGLVSSSCGLGDRIEVEIEGELVPGTFVQIPFRGEDR